MSKYAWLWDQDTKSWEQGRHPPNTRQGKKK